MNVLDVIARILDSFASPILIILLVILDVLSLLLARRERKERLEYMKRMERAARVYSREAYELLILQLTQRARKNVYCYWHSLHSPGESERYRIINEELIEIARSTRKVDLRIITAKEASRIGPAFEFIEEEVPVRFLEALQAVDLRFTLVDDKWLVFGIPETLAEMDEPSREGIDMVCWKLTAILKTYFRDQWETAADYESYAEEVMTRYLKDPTNSLEMIAEQLRLPLTETQRLAKKLSAAPSRETH